MQDARGNRRNKQSVFNNQIWYNPMVTRLTGTAKNIFELI
jgi:hypothetical protein